MHCRSCKFWKRVHEEFRTPESDKYGYCGDDHVGSEPNVDLDKMDDYLKAIGDRISIRTGPKFGCVHWKGKYNFV